MPTDTFTGIVDFPIAARLVANSPFNAPFVVGAQQAGKSIEVLMLIDPTDAADVTLSGSVEMRISDDGGVTFRPNPQVYVPWVGGAHLLTNRPGDTMDPPRVGFSFNLSEVVGKTVGIRGIISKNASVGLGHRFYTGQ